MCGGRSVILAGRDVDRFDAGKCSTDLEWSDIF
jgi:hypothetical protein